VSFMGALPKKRAFSDEVVWPNFRFGSKPDAPYADSQFPVPAVDELSKPAVPDVSFGGIPNPNPTFKALSDLATQVKGAVLMGHSQSGPFPFAAALLNPSVAKGLVLVEPGRCPTNYTDEQIKTPPSGPLYRGMRRRWSVGGLASANRGRQREDRRSEGANRGVSGTLDVTRVLNPSGA